MGSPISFSGFNQIDFGMILNAVMEQERAPIRALETQKKTLETQNTTFGTFLGKLSTLESAIKDLARTDSLAKLTATSSDDGVGVTTTSGTLEGSYSVVVNQLARAQVTASSSQYSSVDTVVGTAGTLSLLVANQPPVDIALNGAMTLAQLADAINARSDAPVSASVVQAAPGSYQLVLTGRATGSASAFTISSTVTGGSGLAFNNANAQDARDANLTVNSLPIVSASNTVQGVIPGATLTLTREDPAKTATVAVKRDTAELTKQVEKFIGAYNDILTFAKEQDTAAIAGRASIARDPILRSLRDSLRFSLLADYPQSPGLTRITAAGIEFDQQGRLKLDKKLFESALSTSTSDLQALFGGSTGTGGVFGTLESQLKGFTESGGIVSAARQRLGEQVSSLNRRLDTLEVQLSVRRAALSKEYIAADLAMTQLKAQSSSLASIGGQYRLF